MRRSADWICHIADISVVNAPGTKYIYKEWDVILLAKLLDQACGDMFDFIDDNLYKPLSIKSKRWYKSNCQVTYSVAKGDEGSDESCSNLTAHELLKIGQLFLKDGVFNERRILSKDYIKEAVSPSRRNPGYGYLWWIGDGWYGCRGFGGQNITVVPEKKAVFVMQATPTSRGRSYDDVAWFCLDYL